MTQQEQTPKRRPHPKDSELKSLQREWYKKLESEGFVDCEALLNISHEPVLKRFHSIDFQYHYEPDFFVHKREYFYQATQFLHQRAWGSLIEQEIWSCHCEGMGVRLIAERIMTRMDVILYGDVYNKDKVSGIIRRLKKDLEAFLKAKQSSCEEETEK